MIIAIHLFNPNRVTSKGINIWMTTKYCPLVIKLNNSNKKFAFEKNKLILYFEEHAYPFNEIPSLKRVTAEINLFQLSDNDHWNKILWI